MPKKITLATIYSQLQTVSNKVETLSDQVLKIGAVQDTMALRLISIEIKLEDHSTILASLRERVDAMHGLVEKLDVRVGRLEQEYAMITAALRRLEIRYDALEAERLAGRISALESRVSALESAGT